MPHGVGARYLEVCESTNSFAGDLAREGELQPLWVIAGEQTAGRGRRGREWSSQQGNLFASLLLRPAIGPADLTAIPFITALAIRDTFIDLGAVPERVQCKWPNDVLIGGRKASGTLIESSAKDQTRLDHLIIGIGMNLMHAPETALFDATSLRSEIGVDVKLRDAVTRLAHNMFKRLDAWAIDDISPIIAEWSHNAWGLGERRLIRTHADQFSGVPVRLGEDGGLVVLLDDGSERILYAGDVFPVSAE